MATIAVADKNANDDRFDEFFSLILKGSVDERPLVKKAVNWALRQIGKRNLSLNKKAITVSEKLMLMDSRSAKWIGKDAFRELTSDSIQKRVVN